MVAAQEGDDGAQRLADRMRSPRAHKGDALDVLRRKDVEEGADVGNGALAGRVHKLRRVTGCSEVFDSSELAGGLFEVRGVSGGRAGDEVFTGVGVDHELLGL